MNSFIRVLQSLVFSKIDFVVVGGFAGVLHGNSRFTSDIDIVCRLEKQNLTKLVKSLIELGLKPRLPVDAYLFAEDDIRNSWIKEKNLMVFSFDDPSSPLFSIDIFAFYPMDYEELFSQSVLKQIDGFSVRISSIEHLILMKEKANRPQDILDISILKKLIGR
jgi:predicted nucleotidyltransferase